MVIFGAGASFDSAMYDQHPAVEMLRPPLANDLFSDRDLLATVRRQYAKLNGLIPQLQPHGDRSLEATLQRFSNEAATDPDRKQQLMAVRYYIRDVFHTLGAEWLNRIGNFSAYDGLLEALRHFNNRKEEIALVTFNYDTLLESALANLLGRKFPMVGDYISDPIYKVFKLHGSENWGRHLEAAPPAQLFQGDRTSRGGAERMIRDVAVITPSTNFAVYESMERRQGDLPLYPAIAIPVEQKTFSSFECPQDHLNLLRRAIPRVAKILAVGWKGAEEHFMGMLAAGLQNRVAAYAIGGKVSEADATLRALETSSPHGLDRIGASAGFRASLRDGALDRFLAL